MMIDDSLMFLINIIFISIYIITTYSGTLTIH